MNSTVCIRRFVVKKLISGFKYPYIRALSNYVLFHVINKVERNTPFKLTRHRFLKPTGLQVQINKVCNFDCAFCFVNDLNEKVAHGFTVSPETFEKMLTHPLLNSLTRLGFTGGEPLVHPNLFDYIERAKQRIPMVTLCTNLALAGKVTEGDRNIDRINRSSLDMITVSLYARGANAIEQFAPQLSDKFFKRLSFMVSAGNDPFHRFDRMYEVAEAAVRLGFHGIYYQNFEGMEGVPEQKANLNKMDISGFSPVVYDPNNDIYKRYLDIRDRVQKDFGRKISICFPVAKRKIENMRKSFNCYQPDFQIGVDAKGTLSPCCNLDRLPEFGNLFAEDNWNNEVFRRIRAGIKKVGETPTPYCANCIYLDINSHDL